MKKRIFTALTLTAIILSATFTANATPIDVTYDDIKIYVNDKEVKSDTSPFIFNGRTFLPIRPVAEALGGYVSWNNEAKTVDIISTDLRIYELKDLAYGLNCINDCITTVMSIETNANDLINHRNDLIANCWSNLNETLNNRISSLDGTSKHLEWQIETYIPMLSEYPNSKAVNTDDIKNAFYCCQMAIHNIKLAYDELKKYNPNQDNSIILQEYAVYKEKATTYNTDAHNIFLKCKNNIFDVINSY